MRHFHRATFNLSSTKSRFPTRIPISSDFNNLNGWDLKFLSLMGYAYPIHKFVQVLGTRRIHRSPIYPSNFSFYSPFINSHKSNERQLSIDWSGSNYASLYLSNQDGIDSSSRVEKFKWHVRNGGEIVPGMRLATMSIAKGFEPDKPMSIIGFSQCYDIDLFAPNFIPWEKARLSMRNFNWIQMAYYRLNYFFTRHSKDIGYSHGYDTLMAIIRQDKPYQPSKMMENFIRIYVWGFSFTFLLLCNVSSDAYLDIILAFSIFWPFYWFAVVALCLWTIMI